MKEFRINKYLSLKLHQRSTVIYVQDRYFIQCKKLILNIPKENVELYDDVDSIDEAAKIYEAQYDRGKITDENDVNLENGEREWDLTISPQEEFWAHCSNLQTWAENNYDTRILKSELAFPLLKELVNVGDPKAKAVFKEEIAKRLASGYQPVIEYLFEQKYLNYLSSEELLFSLLVPKEAEVLLKLEQKYGVIFKFKPNSMSSPLFSKHHELLRPNVRTFSIMSKHVTYLNLKRCGFLKIPNSLSTLTHLEELIFIMDNINEIPESFRNLIQLKRLSLNRCGLNELPKGLENIKSLEELSLTGNNISDISEIKLPKNIKKIDLRKNPVTDVDFRKVLPNIEIKYS